MLSVTYVDVRNKILKQHLFLKVCCLKCIKALSFFYKTEKKQKGIIYLNVAQGEQTGYATGHHP